MNINNCIKNIFLKNIHQLIKNETNVNKGKIQYILTIISYKSVGK